MAGDQWWGIGVAGVLLATLAWYSGPPLLGFDYLKPGCGPPPPGGRELPDAGWYEPCEGPDDSCVFGGECVPTRTCAATHPHAPEEPGWGYCL